MELEELEKIWKQSGQPPLQEPDVEKALRQRSRNDISRMSANLLAELLIVLFSVAVVSVFYFTVLGGRLKEISWMYMLLAIAFLVYYYAKSRLLKSMLVGTGSVRQNLEKQLSRLETYTRRYVLTGSLLVPVVMIAFYVLLEQKNIPLQILGVSRGSDSFTVLYFLCTLALTVGLYIFNKWNVNLLYGNYIKKLQSMLAELNEP